MDDDLTHKISLLTDIEEKNPTNTFVNLSKIIKGIVYGTKPSYTIGIYGEWGTGKTTLMKSIEKNLDKYSDDDSKIYTVWFNAWRYERESEASIPLILTILEKLSYICSNDLPTKWHSDIKVQLCKFVKNCSIRVSIPIGFANIGFTYSNNEVDHNKIPKPNIQEGIELVKLLIKTIESNLKLKLKLVVFIDDLDRCSSTKMLEIFESVKIFLDIYGIIYVMGLNLNVIKQKIEYRDTGHLINNEKYIQKIIQIPIRIPIWENKDCAQLFNNNIVNHIDQNIIDLLKPKMDLLFKAVEQNPRRLKIMINSFIVASKIYNNADSKKLLVVELMRSIWNDMYNKFSTSESFRDKIKNLTNDDERYGELSILHKKRNNGDMLTKEDEIILNTDDEFWQFYNDAKLDLENIVDWPKYRDATKSIENGKKINLNDFDVYFYDGVDHHVAGNYLEAIKCYDAAIEIKPDHDAYNNKGASLAKLGKYTEAIECYDKAIEIKPDHEVYNNKGTSLSKLGKYTEAIECYDKAIEIKPNHNAYFNKGISLSKLGKYTEAIECYDNAIEIKLDYANAYNNKGASLAKLGKYTEAIECYDKAIEIKPNHDAYFNKGISLDKLGKYTEAIECYDKAIELKPDHANAYFNKGISLDKLGKTKEANLCYNIANELKVRG